MGCVARGIPARDLMQTANQAHLDEVSPLKLMNSISNVDGSQDHLFWGFIYRYMRVTSFHKLL